MATFHLSTGKQIHLSDGAVEELLKRAISVERAESGAMAERFTVTVPGIGTDMGPVALSISVNIFSNGWNAIRTFWAAQWEEKERVEKTEKTGEGIPWAGDDSPLDDEELWNNDAKWGKVEGGY